MEELAVIRVQSRLNIRNAASPPTSVQSESLQSEYMEKSDCEDANLYEWISNE